MVCAGCGKAGAAVRAALLFALLWKGLHSAMVHGGPLMCALAMADGRLWHEIAGLLHSIETAAQLTPQVAVLVLNTFATVDRNTATCS